MTNEEHIKNLKTIGYDGWTVTEEAYKSLQYVIKALERETGIVKAQWKYDDSDRTVICSNCHTWFITNGRLVFMRYCPYCGIKMRSDVLVIESEG